MMLKVGKVIDTQITICPIRDEQEVITGTSSIIQDITYEKLGERALEYEDRYRTLVEDMNVGVYRSTGRSPGQVCLGKHSITPDSRLRLHG